MKTKSIISITVLVAVLSAAICSAGQEKIDLKLRLKPGESHEMKIVQNQNISQTMGGQEMKMKQSQEIVVGIECMKVDSNGIMNIQMTYKSMKMVMDGPMGPMEFDSANPKPSDTNNPAEKMMADMFSNVVGCRFEMKIAPTGRISDIEGIGAMLEKMKEKAGPQAQMMDEFSNQMFNEDQIKGMTGNMLGIFPAVPVAVGDTWDDTMSMDIGFPLDVKTTYILRQIDKDIACIDAAADMNMGDASKIVEMGPMRFSMHMSGRMSSSSQVNKKTGLTLKGNTTMNFSGMMKTEASEQMPQEMTIPMTIEGDVSVELIK